MYSRLLLPAFLLLAQTIAGQTPPPLPSTSGHPNYYDKITNSLIKLELTTATYTVRQEGRRSFKTTFSVPGRKSFIRLNYRKDGLFVIRLNDSQGKPSDWFTLFEADTSRTGRYAFYTLGTSNSRVVNCSSKSGIVGYNAKKVEKDLYEIVPVLPLKRGEYFFINRGTLGDHDGKAVDAFAFGID